MATIVVKEPPAERPRVHRVGWSEFLYGLRRPRRFAWELVTRVQQDRTLTLAAALAYYFFFALFPFLLFVLALVTVLPLRGVDDWLLASLSQVVPGEAYHMLERAVRGLLARPRTGLLSLGAVLALWSASSAFAGVMDGLNLAYRVPECRPWWRIRLQAIGLTVALSALMIVAFVLGPFGGQLAQLVGRTLGPAGVMAALVARWIIVLAAVSTAVAVMYYACPDVEQEFVWVTPGSVLFALGFAATSAGFSYYVGHFASYDATYGSLGAVIILLFWMYLFAFLLLLGGQVNAVIEHMSPAGKAPGEKKQPETAAGAEARAAPGR